ncbi:hypothetical protein EJB05_36899 [Eragrostis curvula]|uniref:Uncharacterized protein n=1 Tax=Eragrostis curvula TaxID=38414 RepID=A0A5J9TZZ6_9POAL|nr:hypothetical protein EJB05_36899 [Eragrostis curvula]
MVLTAVGKSAVVNIKHFNARARLWALHHRLRGQASRGGSSLAGNTKQSTRAAIGAAKDFFRRQLCVRPPHNGTTPAIASPLATKAIDNGVLFASSGKCF